MTENIVAAFLRNVPLFSKFATEDLADIAGSFYTRTYKKMAVLVREGEPADALFVLVKGHVVVTRLSPAGKETMLSVLKEGEVFGEMGLIDAEPRSATVRALTVAQVAVLSRDKFLGLLEKRPQMNRVIVSALSARLRSTNRAIESASYYDSTTKVAELLLLLEQKFGERVEGGSRLTLRLTNQDMASMVGLSRESVNRTLNRLWDKKHIDMSTPHIIVCDSLKFATRAA